MNYDLQKEFDEYLGENLPSLKGKKFVIYNGDLEIKDKDKNTLYTLNNGSVYLSLLPKPKIYFKGSDIVNIDIDEILSPKIKKHCLSLYLEGHYDCASHKAMALVELALKEKARITGDDSKKLYGISLIKELFSENKGGKQKKSIPVKLRVPLGDEQQENAKQMFVGVFAYYRNYCAHDVSKITKEICLRIMIIASELLDLIDASSLSYEDIGGIDGILKFGNFENSLVLYNLLKFLENTYVLDSDINSFYEELYENDFTDSQFKVLTELDLVRYVTNDNNYDFDTGDFIGIGNFALTDSGKKVLRNIEIIEKLND